MKKQGNQGPESQYKSMTENKRWISAISMDFIDDNTNDMLIVYFDVFRNPYVELFSSCVFNLSDCFPYLFL